MIPAGFDVWGVLIWLVDPTRPASLWALVIPIIIYRFTPKGGRRSLLLIPSAMVSIVIVSSLVIVSGEIAEYRLEKRFEALDLNGDGVYTPAETAGWTEAERRLRDRYYGDGGRKIFRWFMYPAMVTAYVVLVYLLAHLVGGLTTVFSRPPKAES